MRKEDKLSKKEIILNKKLQKDGKSLQKPKKHESSEQKVSDVEENIEDESIRQSQSKPKKKSNPRQKSQQKHHQSRSLNSGKPKFDDLGKSGYYEKFQSNRVHKEQINKINDQQQKETLKKLNKLKSQFQTLLKTLEKKINRNIMKGENQQNSKDKEHNLKQNNKTVGINLQKNQQKIYDSINQKKQLTFEKKKQSRVQKRLNKIIQEIQRQQILLRQIKADIQKVTLRKFFDLHQQIRSINKNIQQISRMQYKSSFYVRCNIFRDYYYPIFTLWSEDFIKSFISFCEYSKIKYSANDENYIKKFMKQCLQTSRQIFIDQIKNQIDGNPDEKDPSQKNQIEQQLQNFCKNLSQFYTDRVQYLIDLEIEDKKIFFSQLFTNQNIHKAFIQLLFSTSFSEFLKLQDLSELKKIKQLKFGKVKVKQLYLKIQSRIQKKKINASFCPQLFSKSSFFYDQKQFMAIFDELHTFVTNNITIIKLFSECLKEMKSTIFDMDKQKYNNVQITDEKVKNALSQIHIHLIDLPKQLFFGIGTKQKVKISPIKNQIVVFLNTHQLYPFRDDRNFETKSIFQSFLLYNILHELMHALIRQLNILVNPQDNSIQIDEENNQNKYLPEAGYYFQKFLYGYEPVYIRHTDFQKVKQIVEDENINLSDVRIQIQKLYKSRNHSNFSSRKNKTTNIKVYHRQLNPLQPIIFLAEQRICGYKYVRALPKRKPEQF